VPGAAGGGDGGGEGLASAAGGGFVDGAAAGTCVMALHCLQRIFFPRRSGRRFIVRPQPAQGMAMVPAGGFPSEGAAGGGAAGAGGGASGTIGLIAMCLVELDKVSGDTGPAGRGIIAPQRRHLNSLSVWTKPSLSLSEVLHDGHTSVVTLAHSTADRGRHKLSAVYLFPGHADKRDRWGTRGADRGRPRNCGAWTCVRRTPRRPADGPLPPGWGDGRLRAP